MGFLSEIVRDARGALQPGREAAGLHPASLQPAPPSGVAPAATETALLPDSLPPAQSDSERPGVFTQPLQTPPASPLPDPAVADHDARVMPPGQEPLQRKVAKAAPAARTLTDTPSFAATVTQESRKADTVSETAGTQAEPPVVLRAAEPAVAASERHEKPATIDPSPSAPRARFEEHVPADTQPVTSAPQSPVAPSPDRPLAGVRDPSQGPLSPAAPSDAAVQTVATAARPAQTGAPAQQRYGVVDSYAVPAPPGVPQHNGRDRHPVQQAQEPAGPRVHIGQVDIVVTTAPREAARRETGSFDKHLVSRRYLRRL